MNLKFLMGLGHFSLSVLEAIASEGGLGSTLLSLLCIFPFCMPSSYKKNKNLNKKKIRKKMKFQSVQIDECNPSVMEL